MFYLHSDSVLAKPPSFSIGKAKKLDAKNVLTASPGPIYNTNDSFNQTTPRGPAVTIPKEKRDVSPGKTGTPAPNRYSPDFESVRKRSPNAKFGTSGRTYLSNIGRDVSPGPGAHDVLQAFKSTKPSVGFARQGSKRAFQVQQAPSKQIPGPGQYDPRDDFSTQNPSTPRTVMYLTG